MAGCLDVPAAVRSISSGAQSTRLTRPDDQAFVVLTYHRVGGRSPSPVDLPADMFDEQLDVLAATSRVIGLDDAITGLVAPPPPLTMSADAPPSC